LPASPPAPAPRAWPADSCRKVPPTCRA